MTRIYDPIPLAFFNSNFWWRQLAAGRSLKFAPCRGDFGWTLLPKECYGSSLGGRGSTPNLPIERRTLYHWASAAPTECLSNFRMQSHPMEYFLETVLSETGARIWCGWRLCQDCYFTVHRNCFWEGSRLILNWAVSEVPAASKRSHVA